MMKNEKEESGFDDLKISNIGKEIELRGVISRAKPRRVMAKKVWYECNNCGNHIEDTFDEETKLARNGIIDSPWDFNLECDKCKKQEMRWRQDKTEFINVKMVTLMEDVLDVHRGMMPREVRILLEGYNTKYGIGDRIIVNGVLLSDGDDVIHSRNSFLWVNSVKPYKERPLLSERGKEIQEYANKHKDDPIQYYKNLSTYVAPLVEGFETIKMALLLSMIGSQEFTMQGLMKRSMIHILLIGDHGTPMTHMLTSLQPLANRFHYLRGSGTTRVGLTANVVMNDDGDPEVMSGIIPLTLNGNVALDELEKIKEQDMNSLVNAMKDGTIHMNKYSIHEIIDGSTSIIGASTYKEIRFENNRLTDTLDLPPYLIYAFDLIFNIEENPLKIMDKKMVEKTRELRELIRIGEMNEYPLHDDDADVEEMQAIIRDLIKYTRNFPSEIRLSNDALEKIGDYWVKIRQDAKEYGTPLVTINTIFTIIRLSIASAKGRLSSTVEDGDVDVAKMVVSGMLESLGVRLN